MRMSKLVGRRIKEDPRDAQTVSHKFLIRGGYVRLVSAGIYSLLPIAKRITAKIENIIREEMNAIDGQEILMPVILPRDLWDESGRYESIGPELLRFKDRNGKEMLLAMTHEEAICHLTRTEVNSYKQLPVMLYQIQTKYRDEARPRAGLIRVREFTMKDAYSFHTSNECLDEYYEKAHKAYEKIFKRIGLKEVISIQSDTGMMGGKVAHEFMALSENGEDTIFMSEDRKYKANKEVATAAWKFPEGRVKNLEKISTPGRKTIEDVSEFLGLKPENTGKAVFYVDGDANLIFVLIRGDFEVNETKLKNYLKTPILNFANDEQIKKSGAIPGYASPIGLDPKHVRIIVDCSVVKTANLVVGANEENFHFRNFNLERDLPEAEIVEIATVREGDPCPISGKPLHIYRGIEIGNIFKLGTKYSLPMNCNYLDSNGKSQPMIMGCYGIGIGRNMAAVIEQSHDDYGPIWPITIAPYQVHLCAINISSPEVAKASDELYNILMDKGIEVLYDDRDEKPGYMFNDADLIGIPLRIIVSSKNLKSNIVEFKMRGQKEIIPVPFAEIFEFLKQKIKTETARFKLMV